MQTINDSLINDLEAVLVDSVGLRIARALSRTGEECIRLELGVTLEDAPNTTQLTASEARRAAEGLLLLARVLEARSK